MKMDHGIIAMWKTSIILVVGLMFLLYGIFAYSGASKTYWTNVGPTWNRLLNPDTHND
jgi:hypothetical protein